MRKSEIVLNRDRLPDLLTKIKLLKDMKGDLGHLQAIGNCTRDVLVLLTAPGEPVLIGGIRQLGGRVSIVQLTSIAQHYGLDEQLSWEVWGEVDQLNKPRRLWLF